MRVVLLPFRGETESCHNKAHTDDQIPVAQIAVYGNMDSTVGRGVEDDYPHQANDAADRHGRSGPAVTDPRRLGRISTFVLAHRSSCCNGLQESTVVDTQSLSRPDRNTTTI